MDMVTGAPHRLFGRYDDDGRRERFVDQRSEHFIVDERNNRVDGRYWDVDYGRGDDRREYHWIPGRGL